MRLSVHARHYSPLGASRQNLTVSWSVAKMRHRWRVLGWSIISWATHIARNNPGGIRMKARILLVIAASAITYMAFIGTLPSSAQPNDKRTATAKWEYKRAENPKDADLALLGGEGWELVTVVGGQPYVKNSAAGGG